ncbi:cellulose synthase family protein [Bacteroidota bacterium]
MMGYIFLGVYTLCLFCIFIYSLAQGHLTFLYVKSKRKKLEAAPLLPAQLPMVIVQLPLYNELYVVERLLTKVALLDYPLDKLEIQVLDDSTDESVEVAKALIEKLRKTGLDITHITRENRVGFKAGALAYGLKRAKGEFVAIFDADFLPEKDFLLKTLPYFEDAEIGMVQTKWEHLNQNYNLLTRLLSMALDAHFTIEQKGRNATGNFMNFNGTAGVWRISCIEASGGWSADTLTEDLDLSYRAQLKGWKMKYLEEYSSPAEIPAFLPAVRSQQFRWNKGGAEVARKNLGRVLKAGLPLHVKVHALFHLLNTGIFLAVFTSAVVSVPLFFWLATSTFNQDYLSYTYMFFAGFAILAIFYWTTIRQRHANAFSTTLQFALYFPVFLSLSMGLSLFNSIAVLEGYLGVKTPFVRTPKFNIVGNATGTKSNKYIRSRPPVIAILEGLLALYFFMAVYKGFTLAYYPFIPFHALLALGFSGIFYYSIKHSFIRL